MKGTMLDGSVVVWREALSWSEEHHENPQVKRLPVVIWARASRMMHYRRRYQLS
jgi:hypothetical protein